MEEKRKTVFSRFGLPARVGLICAALGMILAIVGIIRGNVPLNPVSILLALLISGGSWGVVSWADHHRGGGRGARSGRGHGR